MKKDWTEQKELASSITKHYNLISGCFMYKINFTQNLKRIALVLVLARYTSIIFQNPVFIITRTKLNQFN